VPVNYSLIGPLLKLNLEGHYEPGDIISQFLAALADPRCPAKVSLLVDVTQSDSLETRAPQEIRRVAEYLGPYRERIGGRCAVVAARDLHFGLSSMGSAYIEGIGIEAGIFRDTKSALDWLGVPSTDPVASPKSDL
jgi:hypothetical protein